MEQQDFNAFIERVKDKVDITDVVEKCGFSLRRDGANFRATAPKSLVVCPNHGNYFHYGDEGVKGWTGDHITFVQTYGGRPEFMDALKYVAELAGEPVPEFVNSAPGPAAKAFRERVELWDIVCNWLEQRLWDTPAALEYARGRGWTDETIRRSRLGFTGATPELIQDLRGELQMYEHDPLSAAAVSILGLDAKRGADGIRDWCEKYEVDYDALPESGQKGRIWGLLDFPRLVYPHIERGRVVYFSARNLKWGGGAGEGPLSGDPEYKSWNLPKALVGDRPRYFNALFHKKAEMAVIAEGPADGVTWAQWGVPCVCLVSAGMGVDVSERLEDVETVFAGTDNGETGRKAVDRIGEILGPMVRVVRFPVGADDGEDANDWLQAMLKSGAVPKQAGDTPNRENASVMAQAEMASELLEMCKPYVVYLAKSVSGLSSPMRREAMTNKVVKLAAKLTDAEYVIHRKDIDNFIGIGLGKLDELVRGIQKEDDKKEKKDDSEPTFTTGGWIFDHLVEILYDRETNKTRLAVRFPDGRVEECDSVMIEGLKYKAIPPNSIIEKNAVRFPSRLGPVMSEPDLIAACRYHIAKYYDFGADSFFEMISSLYPLFSHLYDGFRELSYLRALGDYGTGKTRFLKTVGLLCYRPIYVTGGSSVPSLFRLIDMYRGTLVLNEGDFGGSDDASDIAKILNGGTERGEAITKVKGTSGNFDIEAFEVYGPKVIATRKEFDDRAIASRCLTMEMAPMNPHPRIPINIPKEFEDEASEIRNMLITYRMHNAQPDFDVDQSLVDRSIEPRLSQVTLSMVSMMKDEGAREQIRNFLREYNLEMKSERYGTQTARILEGILRAWAWGPVSDHPSDEMRTYLKDVAKATNDVTDEQNRKMGDDHDDDDVGDSPKKAKKMTSRKVSSIMKKYLQLKTVRATDGGNPEYKGTMYVDWDSERIKALCERWGVEWLERGSVARPQVLDLNQRSRAEERELWQNT